MFNFHFGLILLYQLILFGTIDRIQKAIEKKEYDKAAELIIKGLEKEPENPGVSYYQAQLLFDQEYAYYDLDSARIVTKEALQKYQNADQSLLDDLAEDGITDTDIHKLLDQIRDKAFRNTLNDLSITKAKAYQKDFPNSIYDDILTYKIDSIEYKNASEVRTQSALLGFIKNNPTSVFKPKADSILDLMRYTDLERDGNLRSYYSFLEKNPFTPYRKQIETYILKVSSASGDTQTLDKFISLAETPELKKQAGDVKYYIIPDGQHSNHPQEDSLIVASKVSSLKLFPVVEDGSIGFYDSEGVQRISPAYSSVIDQYTCDLIRDDWVFIQDENSGRILTKEGREVLSGVQDYQSLSSSVGLVKIDGSWRLFHKSGFLILDESVEKAEIMINEWIKIKQNKKWGLISILGLKIAESSYDDIYQQGDFWVFEKDGLLAAYTKALILEEVEDKGLSLEFKFDDIEFVNNHSIIGFRGNRECLLDSSLNFLIPWGEYEIYPEESGWYLKSAKGYLLYNASEEDIMDEHYEYLESNDGWLAIKTSSDWMLLPRFENLVPSRGYDSLKVISDYACMLIKDQSRELLFSNGTKIPCDESTIFTFPNKPEYLILKNEGESYLLNNQGKILLEGEFEKVSFVNDTLIKVQKKSKQGLINIKGDWILNPLFDSIDEQDGLILTLIDGKIGSYDLVLNQLIEADYSARISRLNGHYLTQKDQKYGVIDLDGNEVISFNYDAIMFWNDTSYLVKKEEYYSIINESEESLHPAMESVRLLVQNDVHAIYSFISNGRYGLISSTFGELLSPDFTEIFNLGSKNDPLIFADQHLNKAGFHVVSYINQRGELVLSRAYTKSEFEKILCDN